MKLFIFFNVVVASISAASAAMLAKRHAGEFLGGQKQSGAAWKRPPKLDVIFDKKKKRGQGRGDDVCGVTSQTTAESARGFNCPASCPLYVQDKTDEKFCSFQCVPETVAACKSLNPKTPIPDPELGTCRSCKVKGCMECATDGSDTCAVCKDGFTLLDGKCSRWTDYIWYAIFVVVGLVSAFLLAWVVSLAHRPVVNQEGLDRGLATRSASKLHKPDFDENGNRDLWPVTTNLLTTPVGGCGVLHLFNFQFMLIVWAAGVLIAWVMMGIAVDTDFFRLGIRSPGETPRDNCIIIAWGFITQQRLMQAKVVFVLVLYIVSFILAISYGVRQLRLHQRMEAERISHKDYCAKCTGLPRFNGQARVEDDLRDFFEQKTRQKVMGVSVCWDYHTKEDMIMKVIDFDAEERVDSRASGKRRASLDSSREGLKDMNCADRAFASWERVLLAPETQKIVKKQHGSSAMTRNSMERFANDDEEEEDSLDVTAELEKLYSTEEAFIVFETESARDAAIKLVSEQDGVWMGQSRLRLEPAACEPQAVLWSNLTDRTESAKIFRFACGFGCIFLALLAWCFCFYLPYARLVAQTDYANGRDPNALARTMFGFVVVAGNALMYIVCSEVSDRIGFKIQSQREVCYMLLYCFSCVFNVLLDLVMAYTMAYKQMVGMGMKTHDGERLANVDIFTDRFETYAMQKSLGQMLLDYAFPSTFLIPFLIEPVVTVGLPLKVMSLIVRTNPLIIGSAADSYLASTPMDLSRYADVLLNLLLAVLMFFFPGGYIVYIFSGLILSHLVIYAYDHFRVLTSIPQCDFATMDVEWWAQWLLSVPVGLLLSCVAFKANCQQDAVHCWENRNVQWFCLALLVGHVLIHTLVLLYVVPMFGMKQVDGHDEPYKKCAESNPSSWFSVNPVHCLRSHYIYNHEPPCDYFLLGKDHLLRVNEKLNLYYSAPTPRVEDYDETKNFAKVKGHFNSAMRGLTKSFGTDSSSGETPKN